MKKNKIIFIITIILLLTGCFKKDSMENIKIITSTYPIQFVVENLYGNHGIIDSIYPNDDNIETFNVTTTLLEKYKDYNLLVFNGLTKEKNFISTMLKNNNELKIIDISSNMHYEYSIEELWLDPNNLLTIANNIKKGFDEYIDSTYLTNEIYDNYNNLKKELTDLDGKYYSSLKSANNKKIIVSDDAFKFLEKYGIEVISLDKDTVTQKTLNTANDLLKSKECENVFIKYKETLDDSIKNIIDDTNSNTISLYTMTNLSEIDTNKTNYISLLNQNLENLELELYKKNEFN